MKEFNHERFQRLLEIAEARDFQIEMIAEEYAEPGYTKFGNGPILFANWNDKTEYNRETNTREKVDDTPSRMCKLFEKLGCEIEWSDEWVQCSGCGKAVRTSPDSYCWTRFEVCFDDGETFCGECIQADPQEYLEMLEGNPNRANTIVDLSECGYVCLQKRDRWGGYECYESGFHEGQNDDPRTVAKDLEARGISDYVFNINGVGQFDASFTVWIRKEHLGLDDKENDCKVLEAAVEKFLKKPLKSEGYSPSRALKTGLRNLSGKLDKLSGEGVKMATINADGSVSAKLVSPQDFIEGNC